MHLRGVLNTTIAKKSFVSLLELIVLIVDLRRQYNGYMGNHR